MRVPSDSSEVRAARLGVAGASRCVEDAFVVFLVRPHPCGRLDRSAEDPGGLTPGEYVALGAARQAAWVLGGAVEPPTWVRTNEEHYEGVLDTAARARYAQARGSYLGRV